MDEVLQRTHQLHVSAEPDGQRQGVVLSSQRLCNRRRLPHQLVAAVFLAHAAETVFRRHFVRCLNRPDQALISGFRIAVIGIGLGLALMQNLLQFRQVLIRLPLLLNRLATADNRRTVKTNQPLFVQHLHGLVVQLFRHAAQTLSYVPLALLIQLQTHIIFDDRPVRRRHVGRQQLLHRRADHVVDIQLRTQTRTHLQHPCQTAQEGLQERVDRLDLHIVVVQQHLLEALSRTPAEHLVRRTLIADHEFPRVAEEVLRPA